MKKIVYLPIIITLCTVFGVRLVSSSQDLPSISTLHNNGAYEFPQQYAQVLCDRPDLRVSVYNSDSWLYVQAIVWDDNDDSLGETKEGKERGDYSALMLHFGEDSTRTPRIDRDYYLNPWPAMTGLYFTIILNDGLKEYVTTTLKKETDDTRGALRYVFTSEGKRVRIDSYLLPLIELNVNPGDTVKLCYYASSPVPALTINSVDASWGYHLNFQIPVSDYHKVILQQGNPIQINRLPEEQSTSN